MTVSFVRMHRAAREHGLTLLQAARRCQQADALRQRAADRRRAAARRFAGPDDLEADTWLESYERFDAEAIAAELAADSDPEFRPEDLQ